jgi:hypothetical protein
LDRAKLAALILITSGVLFLIIAFILRLMAPIGGLVCMPLGSQCQYYYDGTTIPIGLLVLIFALLGALALAIGINTYVKQRRRQEKSS